MVEAAKAEDALRFSGKHPEEIDLLLTDVVMPEMSGRELTDRLKAQRPNMKVLFMSGYTDEAIVRRGVLDSNVEFIQKPFTPAALPTMPSPTCSCVPAIAYPAPVCCARWCSGISM